jgi:hypothetical protein
MGRIDGGEGGQAVPPAGGAQPADRGVRKVARELDLDRKDVERAVKVASISPEAKQAARDAGLDNNRQALLAVAKEATPEAQVAKVQTILLAKAAPNAGNQPVAVSAVTAHPIGALNRFAEFCCINLPTSLALTIPTAGVAEVRDSIKIIISWLSDFVTALDDVETIDAALASAKTKQGPDIVPPAEHQLLPAARDIWSDLDIPSFLDRRVSADTSKRRTDVPAP